LLVANLNYAAPTSKIPGQRLPVIALGLQIRLKLNFHREDPVADEIRGFIGALNEDEQIDLVALAWLGRGDGTIDDWDELRAEGS
jgi:hypothetical protein